MKSFLFFLLGSFIIFFGNRCTPKFSVRYNDIDSAIRIVNPDHNCNCDYGDKALSLYTSNNGKKNLYYWQSVYIKNIAGVDLLNKGKSTKAELIKLVPELAYYRRFYIEFREKKSNISDTIFKWENIGTAYFLHNKCEGFKPGVTAKELIKKSHNKKFEAALCK